MVLYFETLNLIVISALFMPSEPIYLKM